MSILERMSKYMPSVLEYKSFLGELSSDWNTLDRLARINNTGISITKTREAFSDLSESLLHNLVAETSNKLKNEMSSKAQVTVDIVIRNLFERTADIGFLATDEDIRSFLTARENYLECKKTQQIEAADKALKIYKQSKVSLIQRFHEYVAKYSVYYDIILLSPDGKVLAKMDDSNPVERSSDVLIQESLDTQEDYVETYRYTDLQSNLDKALIYSYKVTKSNEDDTPIGVLALFFKFEDEMKSVFENLVGADDWMILSLLDKDGRVIASSDKQQIPLDVTMKKVLDKDYDVVRFAGREYLAKTCQTKGYEGFEGLGWCGHAMVPLEYAYEVNQNKALESMDNEFLESVINTSELFTSEVKQIPYQATKIQKELDRTVNNGKLIDEMGTTGMVLGEISNAGLKTKNIFEDSIKNLNETVISSFISDAEFSAKLAIDIMDRNLYERANDCRWWALAGDFRKILAQELITEEDKQKLEDILSYINNLYTVYTNLFIYNKKGEILAISMPKGERQNEPIKFLKKDIWVSKILNEKWVERTLEIVDSQKYTVSPFAQTQLYGDGEYSYIYNASIRDIEDSKRVLGGIGIVFDSTPQFFAMLDDALPKDETQTSKDGSIGLFVDKEGLIISSTDSKLEIGSKLEIDEKFYTMSAGKSIADIISYKGFNYALGACSSSGYREYKSEEDSYKNDISAIIMMPIGKDEPAKKELEYKKPDKMCITLPKDTPPNAKTTKIITFYIDGEWFGLEAEYCEKTISIDGITPIVAADKNYVYGFKTYKNEILYIVNMTHDLKPSTKEIHHDDEVVIIKIDENPYVSYIGIITEQIGEIKNFPDSMIDSLKGLITNNDLFSTAIIKNNEDERGKMVTLIDHNKIANRLVQPEREMVRRSQLKKD